MGTGEFTDYFVTQCEHVYATITPVNAMGVADADTYNSGTLEVEFAERGTFPTEMMPTMFGNINVYGYLDDLTLTETKLLKKCLGDSDGYSDNNVEVYDWDFGATMFFTEQFDTWVMSGTPHAIKLVKRLPNDDFDGGKFALIWFNPKDEKFYVATKQSDLVSEYAIFTTDGVAERVYHDVNFDSAYNMTEMAVTAYFTQFSNTLYMSWDASCETGRPEIEPCLQKGDYIFITDANWGKSEQIVDKADWKKFFGGRDSVQYTSGYADTTDLYRITVDKSINWDGSEIADPDGDLVKNTGYVQIIKFTPASTGTYTYVSQCSNRGLCNSDDAVCECFKD